MISYEVLKQNPELAEKITFSIKGNDLVQFAREIAADLKKSATPAPPVSSSDTDLLMTIEEAAEFLKVSKVTLWTWEKKKILLPAKIGNMVRYRKSDIIHAMERRSRK